MAEKPWESMTTVDEKLDWLHAAVERLGKISDANAAKLDQREVTLYQRLVALEARMAPPLRRDDPIEK